MSCPGGNTPCSAQGQCLDMKSLASLATVNGELVKTVTSAGTITGYDYGSIPDNPLTWDFNRIKGCLCDKGFGGYDCSLYTCPFGDDPSTTVWFYSHSLNLFIFLLFTIYIIFIMFRANLMKYKHYLVTIKTQIPLQLLH